MKHRMLGTKRGYLFDKCQKLRILSGLAPGNPACRIVLTVCIVIAFLRVAELIARKNHRNALGKEHRQHGIFLHLKPEVANPLSPVGAFGSAVPAVIVIASVVPVLAVLLIMLDIVHIKVTKRESVVIRDVIDDRGTVGVTDDTRGKCAGHALVSL